MHSNIIPSFAGIAAARTDYYYTWHDMPMELYSYSKRRCFRIFGYLFKVIVQKYSSGQVDVDSMMLIDGGRGGGAKYKCLIMIE